MKRPEIIEKEIVELLKQLEKSKEYYQYEFICNSDQSDDMVGLFNIGNGRKILQLLNEGRELQYRHAVYGNVTVRMNPQMNRIFVDKNDNINEKNILYFIFNATGEWFLNKEVN